MDKTEEQALREEWQAFCQNHNNYYISDFREGLDVKLVIDFFLSHFSTLLQQKRTEMEGLVNTEEHICRFNDGPQHCDCFNAGVKDALKVLGGNDE